MARRVTQVSRQLLLVLLVLQLAAAIPYRRFSNSTSGAEIPAESQASTSDIQSARTQELLTPPTKSNRVVRQSSSSVAPSSSSTSYAAQTTIHDVYTMILTTTFTETYCLRQSDNPLTSAQATNAATTSSSHESAGGVAAQTRVSRMSRKQSTSTRKAMFSTPAAPAPSTLTGSLPFASPSTLTPLSTAVSNAAATQFTTTDTSLQTSGIATSQPILSFSGGEASPTASVTTSLLTKSAVFLSAPAVSTSHAAAVSGSLDGTDPFQAIGTDAPPSQLTSTGNHPVSTAGIEAPQDATLQTNKFYANLFLGTGGQSVFTFPYTLNWAKGAGSTESYGMAVQHLDSSQRVAGPANSGVPSSPASYYTNGLNLQQMVLSAKELGSSTQMTVDSLDTFSVNANLYPSGSSPSKRQESSPAITFPLAQGMGFVTALYTSLQPEIRTGSAFSNVTFAGSIGTAYKYRATLSTGIQWLIYAIPDDTTKPTEFNLTSTALLTGPENWSGTIQIAKNPGDSSTEGLFDVSAGVYATNATLSGSVNGNNGQYTLTWNVAGQNLNNQTVLGYALPHMVQSFADETSGSVHQNVTLQTTTKGVATAVTANQWTMTENDLPSNMTFTPWTPGNGPATTYSSDAVNAIYAAAQVDLSEDIDAQTNSDSMYYAGKAFSKFASIVIAVNDICQEQDLAKDGVTRLENALDKFISNTQQHPLVYDTVWKGVASSASYSGDSGADFGNTYYNDHHFHYGYFLHTAAVIAHLDPAWLENGTNRAWVDALARDVSNPSLQDTYFPVFRYFDWFHGHSWAHGLYEAADGKDQESSSEDVMFSYGLKLWGMVTGDKSMEARGNLMLAVQARSLQSYYLLADDNKNQPADYIGNKVAGILFENKADHTTYFGTNIEYIQGIHMVPLIPASALTRTSTFVKQEWDTYFADGATDPASQVAGGWRGILYANLALTDPKASYEFFSSPNFDSSYLDGGASRTWYLAFAAGLGGATA